MQESVSAFELKHSGAMTAVHAYLTTPEGTTATHETRARCVRFARIFMKIEVRLLGPENVVMHLKQY